MLNSFTEIFERYFGGRAVYAVYVLLLVLLFWRRKKSKTAEALLLLTVMIFLLVCNPLARLVWIRVVREHLYWRMFWLLPTGILAAFLLTEIISSKNRMVSAAAAAAFLAGMILCGSNLYLNGNFTRATNPFKIPQSAATIGNYLLQEEEGKETEVLASSELFCYLRQYSSRIHLLYGRNIQGYTSPVTDEKKHRLYEMMQAESLDGDYIFSAAGEYGCTYVILEDRKPLTGNPEQYGDERKTDIGGYCLYRTGNA